RIEMTSGSPQVALDVGERSDLYHLHQQAIDLDLQVQQVDLPPSAHDPGAPVRTRRGGPGRTASSRAGRPPLPATPAPEVPRQPHPGAHPADERGAEAAGHAGRSPGLIDGLVVGEGVVVEDLLDEHALPLVPGRSRWHEAISWGHNRDQRPQLTRKTSEFE